MELKTPEEMLFNKTQINHICSIIRFFLNNQNKSYDKYLVTFFY